MLNIRTCAALAGLAIAHAAPAAATTLFDFDSLTAMTNSPGSAVPLASQLSSQFLASDGVSFTSGAGYVAVVNHVPGCPTCTPSPFNIIAGTAANNTLNYGNPILAAFFSTANTSVKATTNFVRVLGDRVPLGLGTVILEGYDLTGNLVASISAADVGSIGTGVDLSLSVAGIHSVRFYSDNLTVGFDNFEFGALSTVPEPASWAMLVAGFGIVGAVMRRKAAVAA